MLTLIWAVVSAFCASSASAALIPLQTSWTPAANEAPPYYIWQNDPELTEYLSAQGTTGLCIPASIANAVLYETAFKTPKANLNLPGRTTDPQTGQPAVDSNAMIRYFAQACHYDPALRGVRIPDEANCIVQFYQDSGYGKAEVKEIRKDVPGLRPEVRYENRTPNLADIRSALQNGFEVIASVAMLKPAANGAWSKVGSHSFNIYGVTDQGLIVSNPTRAYNVDFVHPVFDVVTFQSFSDTNSPLEVFGRTLERPGAHTLLVGLTLMKPE